MEKPMCDFCGKEPVFANGMCQKCYQKAKYRLSPFYKRDRINTKVEAIKKDLSDGVKVKIIAQKYDVTTQYVYLIKGSMKSS